MTRVRPRKATSAAAGGTNDGLALWGQNHTVRVLEARCPTCGARMQQIRDYFSHEIKTVCRGGCK